MDELERKAAELLDATTQGAAEALGVDATTHVETIQRIIDSAYEVETGLKPPTLRLRWNELHEERVRRYRVYVDGIVEQLSEDTKAWLQTLNH